MKLLSEELSYISDFQIFEESENGQKTMYIQGIFAQAELKNRNGRVYPKSVLEPAVEKYITEYVMTNRALGEMSHPGSPNVDPDRACMLIKELKWDGNNVIGKAKVLSSPKGELLKSLIRDGVQMGVSTRGLGTAKKGQFQNESVDIVQPGYDIRAIDAVTSPSGINCFVNGIMESKEYEIINGEVIERTLDELSQNSDINMQEEVKKRLDVKSVILDINQIFKKQ